jgi:hypothetical protein
MLRNVLKVIRPKLTWLFPADENIWFHRQVAYSMAFWAMVHVTAHYVNFINVERTREYFLSWFQWRSSFSVRGSQRVRSSDSLHSSRRHHWAFHAPYHVPYVLNSTPQDPPTVLRGLLVYSSSRLLLYDRSLHPCHWLFRTRFCQSRLHPHLPILLDSALFGL